MKNEKIRNHISIVIERTGGFIGAILLFVITGFADEIKAMVQGEFLPQNNKSILLAIVFIVMILMLLIGFQIWKWSKTFIYLQDKSIVIEQNTFQKRKNTIGIKNVSNVNMEQNFFEMIIGTSKIKLDTNSLSTADKTDVQIVLKKKEAERLRNAIMELMQEEHMHAVQESADENVAWDIESNLSDLLSHGFFSISIWSVLVVLFTGSIVIISLIEAIQNGLKEENIFEVIVSFLAVLVILAGSIWNIAKGFIRYLDFKIARHEDKIYISYGILKKVKYTIPVNKISALQFQQTLHARLTKRYMAKIINIGMGDDKEEAESFFLPYCRLTVLQKQLEKLLPEFYDGHEKKLEAQPAAVWFAWLYPFLIFAAAVLIVSFTVWSMYDQFHVYIIAADIFIFIWGIFLMVCYYKTTGFRIQDDYMILASGYFSRTICFLPYKNMQYIQWKQNIFAHFAGIYSGEIHLLASAMNNVKYVPYMYEKNLDIISVKILEK